MEVDAMSADRIEREITIAAPVERVWAVLAEPEHVGQWFGQGKPTEVDLRPGGIMVLDHGENGMFPTRIEKVDPPYFLSYRWASAYPGEETTEDNSTLVEFTLSPDGRRHPAAAGGERLCEPADTGRAARPRVVREPLAGMDRRARGSAAAR
jgi:uncharacterized protein YndB with AHSA1/START domain